MNVAYPIHVSSARLRLRVPGRRHDAAWFDDAAAALAQQPGVTAVRADAERCSLTLRLGAGSASAATAVGSALAAAGIRIQGNNPARFGNRAPGDHGPSVEPPRASLGLRADRRTIALALFLLLLARHLLRNGWLAPGLALAWYLWERFPALRRRFAARGQANRKAPVGMT